MSFSIRKDDMVEVIAGRDRGKKGKVLRLLPKSGRALVEKINMVKRHVRPSQQNPGGGILEKEVPIHYSNILLVCPKCDKGVRHGMKWEDAASGKGSKKAATAEKNKVRFCKKCNETLEKV